MIQNKKCTRLFVVAPTELAMMLLPLEVIHILISLNSENILKQANGEILLDVFMLSLFIIPIIVCLVYMAITYPGKLKVFTDGGAKHNIKHLLTGLGMGFVLNAVLCVAASVSGSLTYTFKGFNFGLLAVFIPCFIQCACEEVLIRGYASSYLEDRYKYDVVAFVGGVLFIFHHISNMKTFGFDARFALNLFLVGVFLYLLMKKTRSIWTCFGFHTAWNFTQEYIFGTPNSGLVSSFALFNGENPVDSFFFNTVYGNEGTLMCTVLFVVAIVCTYMFMRREIEENESGLTPYSY